MQSSCSKHGETLHATGACQQLRERNPVNKNQKEMEGQGMNNRNQGESGVGLRHFSNIEYIEFSKMLVFVKFHCKSFIRLCPVESA